ncbi:MAG: flagellar basal-body rod protein FlgF [Ignavibacteriales bacterium]|nr:flagellar basal-body rod protein FlgF [Ignavibacteriales bacterium]
MIKGIYTSGMGMRPRMLRMEVIANNLANINTTGYKKENLFVSMMDNVGQAATSAQGTATAAGNIDLVGLDARQYTDYSEGGLHQTNNPLDLALQGPGFFAVETPRGVRYTRNGNFTVSIDGTVVNTDGHPLLGKDGKIQIPDVQKLGSNDITIKENGELTIGGKMVSRVRIVDFQDLTQLKKDGASLFHTSEREKEVDPSQGHTTLRQGFLEESNVGGIDEMIEMIDMNRFFESDQKMIQTQDASLQRANEIGRL